jgi:hypothetical protein
MYIKSRHAKILRYFVDNPLITYQGIADISDVTAVTVRVCMTDLAQKNAHLLIGHDLQLSIFNLLGWIHPDRNRYLLQSRIQTTFNTIQQHPTYSIKQIALKSGYTEDTTRKHFDLIYKLFDVNNVGKGKHPARRALYYKLNWFTPNMKSLENML